MKNIENFCVWKVSVIRNQKGDENTSFQNMTEENAPCFFCNGYQNMFKESEKLCDMYVPFKEAGFDKEVYDLVREYLK